MIENLGMVALVLVVLGFVFFIVAVYGLNYFTTKGDWIIAKVTALGTLATATMALGTFFTLTRDKKEKIRNEIMNWAIRVNEIALTDKIEAASNVNDRDFNKLAPEMIKKLDMILSEGVYINIISKKLGDEINRRVGEVIGNLQNQTVIIKQYKRGMPDYVKTVEDIITNSRLLEKNCVNLIGKISKKALNE